MDYATLVNTSATAGSIANWINASTVQASAATIVAEAESFIYRRLRHWQMQTSATGSMTTGNDTIALPTNFLEPKTLYITGINYAKLTMKTEQEVKASYQYDGTGTRVSQKPSIFTFDSTGIRMDSPPDQTYPYELIYYVQPTALSSASTNWVTTYYPRLMRCACMIGACEFVKESGQGNFDRTYWEQATLAEIDVAAQESDRSQRAVEFAGIVL